MALIKCPECGKEISDAAIKCPGCQFPVKEELEKAEKRKQEQIRKEKEKQEREHIEQEQRAREEKKKLEEEKRKHDEKYMKCPECKEEVERIVEICPRCGFPIAENNRKKAEAKEKQKKRTKVMVIGGILFIAIICFFVMADSAKSYEEAIELLDEGRYYEAEEAFEKVGSYKNSEKYAKIAELGSDLEYLAENISDMDSYELGHYENVFEQSESYTEIAEIREAALEALKSEVESLAEYTNNYDKMLKATSICDMIDSYIDVDTLSDICSKNFFALYFKNDTESKSDSNTSTAISSGKVEPYIGMSAHDAEYKCTWGKPSDKNITETKYGTREQWVYRGYGYLYIEDGKVTTIQK